MSLVSEVSRMRAERGGIGRTIEEASPVGSSSSNGVVERGVESVEEQVRVLVTASENRWRSTLPDTRAIWPWLVEYAAYLLNRCSVGSTGKTAYERS